MSTPSIKELQDRILLANYLTVVSEGFLDGLKQNRRHVLQNGRWGTCADCPIDENGLSHPENCINTGRYDHHIHSIRDGMFFVG